MKTHINLLSQLLAVAVMLTAAFPVASAATLTWTTADSQVSTTTNQLRAVAVSDQPGNNSVYTGYIQTSLNRRIDRLDSSSPYATLNSVSLADQPKGIVTDDRGNVFVANRGSSTTSSYVQAFSSTLVAGSTTVATSPVIGGLAVQKSGANYYVYTVYEAGGLVQRYDVTNPAAMTLDATFGVAGSYVIPGASNLRGVDVGADGSLFVAARTDNRVYKVSADLLTVTSNTLNRAMDVALYGGNVYATSYDGVNSFIRVIDAATMSTVDNISIATLDGNPYSRAATEGFAGIDIDSAGRIWLADQHYGSTGGTQDRLLISTSLVPEPTGVALFGIALVGVGLVTRKQRG